jgi:hypothetical protein
MEASEGKKNIRIGQLLTGAGVLSEAQIDEALEKAERQGEPLGQILVHSGKICDEKLRIVIEIQALVRDSQIPYETALKALAKTTKFAELPDILTELGHSTLATEQTNRLGDLLVSAGIITTDELERALKLGQSAGLPIGHIIMALGLAWRELLETALCLQQDLREQSVDRSTAIRTLQALFEKGVPTPVLAFDDKVMPAVASNLTVKDLFDCDPPPYVVQEDKRKMVAQRLIEMVAGGTLSKEGAIQVFKALSAGKSFLESIASIAPEGTQSKISMRFRDLLRVVGLVNIGQLEKAGVPARAKACAEDTLFTQRVLLKERVINERSCFGAVRCYNLMAIGLITAVQGVNLLQKFIEGDYELFDDVLDIEN